MFLLVDVLVKLITLTTSKSHKSGVLQNLYFCGNFIVFIYKPK